MESVNKYIQMKQNMEIQKLIEDAVWREYGQRLDDLRRQSDGGVTANYMVKVVKAVTESALKEVLKQLNIEEQQNEMLIETLEQYKSEIVVLKHENDLQQEHLMHNEAELIQLRKENKDLHFKNDVLEDICLTHQNLTQWIEEQIDEVEPRVFKVEDDFIETLFDEIININHKPYTQAGRV